MALTSQATELAEVRIIDVDVFADERGFFFEAYNAAKLGEVGIAATFVQDNVSFSQRGVLRGLHFQRGLGDHLGQSKFVRVLRGRVLDVVVDIRRGSPTFAQHVTVELSEANKRALWVPAGFAHGFYAYEDTLMLYKCDDIYRPEREGGIRYDDRQIGVDWPGGDKTISPRDGGLPTLDAIENLPTYIGALP
ncbi:MAG: dTDP-4-dehydrorhamnose 3,5-epimerase [Deltaproteobacteria bacterium]|nr:dTDP-4-dehydrorhamnose 3,5-epimerase [Deltaproteobacteria bacterium]